MIDKPHAMPVTTNQRVTTAHCTILALQISSHKFTRSTLINSGSVVNLIPREAIPDADAHLISPRNSVVTGVGERKIIGTVKIDIFTPNGYPLAKQIQFSVVESPFPIILGTPFFNCAVLNRSPNVYHTII